MGTPLLPSLLSATPPSPPLPPSFFSCLPLALHFLFLPSQRHTHFFLDLLIFLSIILFSSPCSSSYSSSTCFLLLRLVSSAPASHNLTLLSGYFYSALSSPLIPRGTPGYSIDAVSELTRRSATGNCE